MAKESFSHDSAYKALFSFPDMVRSLLLDFAPEEFVRHFDFSTLTPCNASYVTPEYNQLHDDVVWSVNWKERQSYLCIILEFQSSEDYWMGVRITGYTAGLWNDLINRKQIKVREKLPPVFPIVLYNGERPWNAPTNIQILVDLPHTSLIPYQPHQEYLVIDAKRISQAEIEKAKGEAAYLIAGEQAQSGDKLLEIGKIFIARSTDLNAANLRRIMVKWLDMRIRKVEPNWSSKPHEEKNYMLAELLREVEKVENKYRAREAVAFKEGEVKGKAEGIARSRAGLLEMLSLRFGNIPSEWRDIISAIADPEKISQLTISILKVNNAEEYGALLASAK